MSDYSERLFAEARQVMPGGVSSPVRAYGSVGGTPRFVHHAAGSHIVDVDGREYVDLVGSWGPMIAGHAQPSVLRAIGQAAAAGTSFGAPALRELELARRICELIEPVERVRFTSSGTEAVMTAARLARAATGRPLVIKFAGCYHGHADAFLVAAGSGVATLALPDSPGVPAEVAADTISLPYGELDAVRAAFAERGEQIAAIVTEAVPANMGVIVPPEGFNAGLVEIAHQHGALVIYDEVLTGFRISPTGAWGVQGAVEGWQPDIFTFGKVIGGGLPLAALAGRAELLDLLAPAGPVYQAGTLSGNPLACAAGAATLDLMTPTAYQLLDRIAAQVASLADQALTSAGVPHQVNAAGNLFSVFLTGTPVRNFVDARAQDAAAFGRFFRALLDNGVWLAPSGYEAWFCSTAITDDDLEAIEKALQVAARAAAV